MRILVTGATGVIGSRVVHRLLAAGHDVTAVVRSMARGGAVALAGASIRPLDLFAPEDVRAAVAGHDVVINLATHIPHSPLNMLMPGAWRENDRIRREGSRNLVDAAVAAGTRRFIQESFAPIYADQGDRWIDERSPVQPASYSRTVLDAEAAAQRLIDLGRAGVVLRFAAFYGPDATQLAVMIQMVRHGWMPLLGPAKSYFPSISHDDAASAVAAALDVPPGTYNVSDDQPLRHREFADALAEAMGLPHPRLPPAWTAALAGSVGRMMSRSLRISNGKLRTASGWAPRYPSAHEGLRAAIDALPPPQAQGAGGSYRANASTRNDQTAATRGTERSAR
jgi:nucleoside-diphosphate-sugar epimerase